MRIKKQIQVVVMVELDATPELHGVHATDTMDYL
jgi:hypothetical protein